MAVTILPQASAFNPGAELWVVPQETSSPILAKLDWYLNFQLSRASRHRSCMLPVEVSSIIKTCALPTINFSQAPETGTLIASDYLLPNRWVLQIPKQDKFDSWCEQLSNHWSKLGKPTLRVFLPQGYASTQFQSHWQAQHPHDDLTLVEST